jgi:tetratricopeptide (TPR) repeat protein
MKACLAAKVTAWACSWPRKALGSVSIAIAVSLLCAGQASHNLMALELSMPPTSAPEATPKQGVELSLSQERDRIDLGVSPHPPQSSKLSQPEDDKTTKEEEVALDLAIMQANADLFDNPQSSEAYRKRGVAQQRKATLTHSEAEYRAAIDDYKRCLERVPTDWEAWVNLGDCYRAVRELDPAEKAYNEAIEVLPRAKGLLLECMDKEKAGHTHAAIRAVDELIQMQPNNAALYYRRAKLYQMNEATQAANADFQRAAQLNPHNMTYFLKAVQIAQIEKRRFAEEEKRRPPTEEEKREQMLARYSTRERQWLTPNGTIAIPANVPEPNEDDLRAAILRTLEMLGGERTGPLTVNWVNPLTKQLGIYPIITVKRVEKLGPATPVPEGYLVRYRPEIGIDYPESFSRYLNSQPSFGGNLLQGFARLVSGPQETKEGRFELGERGWWCPTMREQGVD